MITVTRLFEQRVRFANSDALGSGTASDARRTWSERRILVVVVEDGEGHVGLGEAAPLPEYSPDSLDEAFDDLSPLVGTAIEGAQRPAPASLGELHAATAGLRSPSARFALESALVELRAKGRGEPAWTVLTTFFRELAGGDATSNEATEGGRPLAALLPTEPSAAMAHAERAFGRGIRCFKAKVGARGGWTEELELLRAVRQRFPEALLRVDANRGFSPHELWQRLPALRELGLEWLEEPVRHFPRDLETPVNVPLALDESLQSNPPNTDVAQRHGVCAFVLKPTALGGFARCLELACSARTAGLAAVASHTYEGPIGFSAVAALALALGSGRPAEGLDRHATIADATNLPALDAEHGRIRAWSEPGFGLDLDELFRRHEVTREVRA